VFYNYVRWQGRFEEGYLIDWLGVRTRWPLIPVSLIKSLISWLLTIFYIVHKLDIRGTVSKMEAIIGLFHLDGWNAKDMTPCCRL
jgi:hypothetical protein